MSAPKIDTTWTLFLDRDGVINQRNFDGYIQSVEDFHFLPGVIEGLKQLTSQFSHIIIVTNQQGIGKGVMTHQTLTEIHDYMLRRLRDEGIKVDKIYVATNLKGADNDRRKPSKVMGLEAKADFPSIDFQKAMMVGDTDSDIQFGMNLGMKTVLMRSAEQTNIQTDMIVNSLKELADELKN